MVIITHTTREAAVVRQVREYFHYSSRYRANQRRKGLVGGKLSLSPRYRVITPRVFPGIGEGGTAPTVSRECRGRRRSLADPPRHPAVRAQLTGCRGWSNCLLCPRRRSGGRSTERCRYRPARADVIYSYLMTEIHGVSFWQSLNI